jgi:hypothetical protein
MGNARHLDGSGRCYSRAGSAVAVAAFADVAGRVCALITQVVVRVDLQLLDLLVLVPYGRVGALDRRDTDQGEHERYDYVGRPDDDEVERPALELLRLLLVVVREQRWLKRFRHVPPWVCII